MTVEMPKRKLVMKYAGGLIQHLGLQMYSGAVPSILELVANAWDADATRVDITIPLGRPFNDNDTIEVKDNGIGMTFDEVNEKYLRVGRDRRRAEGTDTTPRGRRVLGRKGIGKLAGFGIAKEIEVWTVKDGHLTAFRLEYDNLISDDFSREYEPPILADRPLSPNDNLHRGTRVILRKLQLKRAINEDEFIRSMTRRFALFSDQFAVYVNGTRIERQELEFDLRIPETGEAEEEIPEFGKVRWWIGFTPKPIKYEELRGVVIYAKGKLAQAPFFFNLSQGVEGQLGMQYLTGEVHADAVDGPTDLIATDRASIRFEDPRAEPLLKWGQNKIREALSQWSRHRVETKLKKSKVVRQVREELQNFPRMERQKIEQAIEKIAEIEGIDSDQFDRMVQYLMSGYHYDHFFDLIERINAADESAVGEIMNLVTEWDVLEAVQLAQVIHGRLRVIETLGKMIDANRREKPDLQEYIKQHPWLLNPGWELLAHERTLDSVLQRQLNIQATGHPQRLDFFCLAHNDTYVVVELKRPNVTAGWDELGQLERYVDTLQTYLSQNTGPDARHTVYGYLIAGDFAPETEIKRDRLERSGMYTLTWSQLFRKAQALHSSLFERTTARAPDDPRVIRAKTLLQSAVGYDQ